jgi:hypothetical protein
LSNNLEFKSFTFNDLRKIQGINIFAEPLFYWHNENFSYLNKDSVNIVRFDSEFKEAFKFLYIPFKKKAIEENRIDYFWLTSDSHILSFKNLLEYNDDSKIYATRYGAYELEVPIPEKNENQILHSIFPDKGLKATSNVIETINKRFNKNYYLKDFCYDPNSKKKVGKKEIYTEYRRSLCLLYIPNEFMLESYCATALETIRNDTILISLDSGALEETNSFGIRLPFYKYFGKTEDIAEEVNFLFEEIKNNSLFIDKFKNKFNLVKELITYEAVSHEWYNFFQYINNKTINHEYHNIELKYNKFFNRKYINYKGMINI